MIRKFLFHLSRKDAKCITSVGHSTDFNVTALHKFYICKKINGLFAKIQNMKPEIQYVAYQMLPNLQNSYSDYIVLHPVGN